MRGAALVAVFAACIAVALAVNPAKCNNTIEHGMEDFQASMVEAEKTFSESDFLAVPFDPVNNAMDKQILESAESDPKFAEFRETLVKLNYHMTVAEYDAIHEKSRASLIAMASELNVEFAPEKETFVSLLARVETAVHEKETASLIETKMTEVMALRANAKVFVGTTMRSAVYDHAVMFSINSLVNKALAYAKTTVAKNKCKWCKGVLTYIKQKACGLAGDFICNAVATAINGPVPGAGVPFKKFICGSPVNLSSKLGTVCTMGIAWLQKKTGYTDNCLCSLIRVPNVTIGAINVKFPVSVTTPSTTFVLGQLCPNAPGCFGKKGANKQDNKGRKPNNKGRKPNNKGRKPNNKGRKPNNKGRKPGTRRR